MILCEKPLADNFLECKKIESLCYERNIPIITNYMRRSLPVIKAIKKKIISQFPSNHDVIVKYSGCFKNNGSHFVDLMSYIYGFPEKIFHRSSMVDNSSYLKVRATIVHKNAICTYIPMSSTSVSDHEVEIITEKFKLIIGKAGREIFTYDVIDDINFEGAFTYGKVSKLESDYLNFQKYVYDDTYLAIETGILPSNLCDIRSSIKNVQFIQEF